MSNKTMYDVELRKIQNVLASEQELMLDLFVGAVNPNVLGVTITEMDVNVFAKSKHLVPSPAPSPSATPSVKSSRHRVNRRVADKPTRPGTPWQDPDGHWNPGEDEPLEGDSQTMLLGRIFHFDQALYFEGSPIKRHMHFSVGEMRLERPGNKTEAGGSERWEKVLQYPFELILRGVLRYQMPISSRTQSAAISGSVCVHPEEGVNGHGHMRVEPIDKSKKWQWVELGDVEDDTDREASS